MKPTTDLFHKGSIALLIIVILVALFTWSFRFDDNILNNARAQTISNGTSVSSAAPIVPISVTPESGYPGPIATATSSLLTPSPTTEIGVDDLPPIEHGHRHFERPSQPIMPTATPMPNVTEQPQPTIIATVELDDDSKIPMESSSLIVGTSTRRFFLPVVLESPYRTVKVFAIAYIDTSISPQSIDTLHSQLISDLTFGSKWHGYQSATSKPAFIYTTYLNAVFKTLEPPPHRSSGLFDYDAVYQRFGLCAKIQNREVDEVWIWESGTGNGGEFVVNGPTWNAIPNGYSVPNCGRTVATFNLRYDLPINNALHSYNHRVEDALIRFAVSNLTTCDFITLNGPPPSKQSDDIPISEPNCTGTFAQNNKLGYVARPMTANGSVSVCGDVHYPPNIQAPWTDQNEYKYSITSSVWSRCQNWQWDLSVPPSSVNCSVWGCNERGYMLWWMQNIPSLGNLSLGRDGNFQPVWWDNLWK